MYNDWVILFMGGGDIVIINLSIATPTFLLQSTKAVPQQYLRFPVFALIYTIKITF